MIVVEGPDGAGKTTLIEKLSRELDIPVAPRVVSKDTQAMVDLKKWTQDNVSQGFQRRIFDRHRLISEPIYGSILRKSFEPGFDDYNWLLAMNYMFYKDCLPIIVYCLPPYETVRANLKNDEDNRVVLPKIRRIYAQYVAKAATDRVFHSAIMYDYTIHDSAEILSSVSRYL